MRIQMLLAALFVALVPALAEAKTIRVPKNQPTIQAAVDAAKDGDTILVSNGSYSEDVVVSGKNNLKIRALVNGKVTIRPATTGMQIDGCNGITVTGLVVVGGETGFLVDASNGVTITRFAVRNAEEDGIRALASSGVHVTFGAITNCGDDGVLLGDDPATAVTASDVKDVTIKDCDDDGIDVLGANVLILRCNVTNAGDDGFTSDGEGAGPVTFRNCRSTNADADGFQLDAPKSKAISCTSALSDDDGFDVEGAQSVVRLCTSVRAGAHGFQIEVNSGTFFRCSAVRSNDAGFDIDVATNCRLEKCTATRSGGSGFFIGADSAGNTLVSNTATHSVDFGLDDESTGANTFTKNKFGSADPN